MSIILSQSNQSKNESWKTMVREEISKIKPYIPGKPIKEVKEELNLDQVIKLASNENPLGVSQKVKEVINQESNNLNLYPDGATRTLVRKLGQKHDIDENMLMCGNGSDGIIKVIGETFLNQDRQVVITYPSFVEYRFIAQLMGSQLIRVWMRNYEHNIEGIVDACTQDTDMIFLANPDNPTGSIFTKEELDYLFDNIPDDVIVILDEAYHEFVQDENYPDGIEYVKKGYPVIVLRTFSKAYSLAGLRLGYAIAQPEIIELLMKARDPFNVNRLAEEAGKAALADTEFLEKAINNNEKGKEYLYKEFDRLGLNYVPTSANFILVNVEMNSMELFENLLEKGVIIRPGKPLGYPGHIRVTVGLPEENEIFIKALEEELD